ncbi:MAG: hypothetical protein P8Z73_08195 [Desulfobacteraceae bacterium]
MYTAVAGHDGQCRAKAGARRYPQQIGADQRIVEHSLKCRSADREPGADHHGHQRPGQPDAKDHHLHGIAPGFFQREKKQFGAEQFQQGQRIDEDTADKQRDDE